MLNRRSKLPTTILISIFFMFQVSFTTKSKNFKKSVTTDLTPNQITLGDNSNLPSCDEDQLMIYLAEIDAINPESIINLVTVEDMESLCTKVYANLDRMQCYLRHCQPPEQKDLYIQLIKGVDTLYEKICAPCPFKSEFEKYFECIQDLNEDFKDCTGPADWTEYCTNEKVCKAYKGILDCYYVKTATLCGLKAAHLFKSLAMSVIDRIITQACNNILPDPVVKNPMPEEYVYSKSIAPKVTSILFVIIFIMNSINLTINCL